MGQDLLCSSAPFLFQTDRYGTCAHSMCVLQPEHAHAPMCVHEGTCMPQYVYENKKTPGIRLHNVSCTQHRMPGQLTHPVSASQLTIGALGFQVCIITMGALGLQVCIISMGTLVLQVCIITMGTLGLQVYIITMGTLGL